MNAKGTVILVTAALVVGAAAVWIESHNRAATEAPAVQRAALPALGDSLDSVTRIRIARGDGVQTTLQRQPAAAGAGAAVGTAAAGPWIVAERNDRVDAEKLKALLINLSSLRVVEEKTSDRARYAVLQVEDAADKASKSVRVDITADGAGAQRSWSLLIGKQAQPQGSYVRVPPAPAALLVEPRLEVDPAPARWIDTLLLDIKAARIQQVQVQTAGAPGYTLARAGRDAADLALARLPPGRKAVSATMLTGAASDLDMLHMDDEHDPAAQLPKESNHVRFTTFDGLVVDLDGWQDGARALVRLHASVDEAVAKRFALPTAAAAAEQKPTDQKPAQPPDVAAEAARINARAQAHDFELPAYKYNAIFRSLDSLLEPVKKAAAKH